MCGRAQLAYNPKALKELAAAGTQFRGFTADALDACYKASNEVYTETYAKNPDFKKIHENMVAFRGDQYLWWQVAEYAFDTYQIRARAKG